MYQDKICIIGLGYVGLPLAAEFSKKFSVTGYDIDKKKIIELKNGIDITKELDKKGIDNLKKIHLTYDSKDLKESKFFIVTVPTPIFKDKKPNLSYLKKASKIVSKNLNKGDFVIYESTTFPGCTENICVPILEKYSKLKLNKDFYCGYSPERINPGDKKHKLNKITKVVSGSNAYASKIISNIYKNITKEKIFVSKSIKVAEASKVIENIQRDINIALMNELSVIFNKLKIEFNEVLKASNTKWNFLNFKPGLVGGHCIGVDPYYLADLAIKNKIYPKIILAGRKTNDKMSDYIVDNVKKRIKKKAKILLIGLSFKEDVPDFRNSQSTIIIKKLLKKGFNLDTFDKLIDIKNLGVSRHYTNFKNLKNKSYDLVLILVGNREIKNKGHMFFKKLLKPSGLLFDIKNIFKNKSDFKL